MPYPIKHHLSDHIYHLSCRTKDSKLWFVNNPKLWSNMLASLAKYQSVYAVEIFGFIIMGNHYHLIARFPKCNKSHFMRDLNASFARLTKKYTDFPGGTLWHSRYREQVLPNYEDVKHMFFYCALNPVYSGLVRNIEKYPGYNSFNDAINQNTISYRYFNAFKYSQAKQRAKSVDKKDFYTNYSLTFSLLPEYRDLNQNEYKEIILKDYAFFYEEAVKNKTFPPLEVILNTVPGSPPKLSKQNERYSYRPLVICKCRETKKKWLESYFRIVESFKEAVQKLKQGFLSYPFPQGTYKPSLMA